MGVDFKSPNNHLRCELLGPCEKDGGLQGDRVRADLMGNDFKSTRIHLRCELLGPCEQAGGLQGERV